MIRIRRVRRSPYGARENRPCGAFEAHINLRASRDLVANVTRESSHVQAAGRLHRTHEGAVQRTRLSALQVGPQRGRSSIRVRLETARRVADRADCFRGDLSRRSNRVSLPRRHQLPDHSRRLRDVRASGDALRLRRHRCPFRPERGVPAGNAARGGARREHRRDRPERIHVHGRHLLLQCARCATVSPRHSRSAWRRTRSTWYSSSPPDRCAISPWD